MDRLNIIAYNIYIRADAKFATLALFEVLTLTLD